MLTKIYRFDELSEIITNDFEIVRKNKNLQYYNIAASFDIETSSFYEDGRKHAIMYIWQVCIVDKVFIGRTWEEFIIFTTELSRILNLSSKLRLILWVHSLSYEFQFIKHFFDWEKVFAIDVNKPCYAITDIGIEFRCSYILSGYSLENLGKQLLWHDVRKTHDLDYSLIRHQYTPLTEKELQYCVNDVLVVCAYIEEKIKKDGDIAHIELTKTGYVRTYCRNSCFYDVGSEKSHRNKSRKYWEYRQEMSYLTMSVDTYKQAKRAFQGGFTHTSFLNSNKLFVGEIYSEDETSAYPYTMVAECGFPMGPEKSREIKSKKDFYYYLRYYCCMFDIEFTNIRTKDIFEDYISYSKCWNCENEVVNNGRIFSADKLCITLTEQDFLIIQKVYTWDNIRVANFKTWQRGYLPTDLVKSILKLYCDKTELKGVEGREADYLNSKELVNAVYGMSVTDPCRDDAIYTSKDGWVLESPVLEDVLNKYNKSPKRFTSYLWGIWVTSLSRKHLFEAIIELGPDYIYSDTDSVKFLNYEKHKQFFEAYNKRCMEKLKKAMEFHNLEFNLCVPKTIKGVEKPLGVWDFEGCYKIFRSCGSKRYMYMDENYEVHITIAGLSKTKGRDYLVKKYGKYGCFKAFTDDMEVPAEETGKNTHTYIDDYHEGVVTDYLGQTAAYKEFSSVHMEKAAFTMSLAQSYVDFLNDYQGVY